VNRIRPSAFATRTADLARAAETAAALRRELSGMSDTLAAVRARMADSRRRAEELVAAYRQDLDERVQIAGLPHARLLADSLVLEGRPSQRMRVRRISVGEAVEIPFHSRMKVTRCVTEAPDVRALWERVLARETSSAVGMLRAFPNTILDVPDATVSTEGMSSLRVAVGQGRGSAGDPPIGVPRFVHATAPRKLRNFSHWLLDCLPQVVTLLRVAPDAACLLPAQLKDFQRYTLSLVGLTPQQVLPWDGGPAGGRRLLIVESDGRAGGGRPFSSLLETRRRIAAATAAPGSAPRTGRRIYISRRDAKRHRRWASNERDVEALFESRGFEIVCPTDHPLPQLVQAFREASFVAGLNGAGLAHLLFAPPGTQLIVLLTDSLVRWYADEGGARSLWAGEHHIVPGELSALGDSPRFYAHVAAAFDQDCHSFVCGDEVPLDRMSGFLDDVFAQATRE
jgi:hypothetical protein